MEGTEGVERKKSNNCTKRQPTHQNLWCAVSTQKMTEIVLEANREISVHVRENDLVMERLSRFLLQRICGATESSHK